MRRHRRDRVRKILAQPALVPPPDVVLQLITTKFPATAVQVSADIAWMIAKLERGQVEYDADRARRLGHVAAEPVAP